jgi:hypothetical protein
VFPRGKKKKKKKKKKKRIDLGWMEEEESEDEVDANVYTMLVCSLMITTVKNGMEAKNV